MRKVLQLRHFLLAAVLAAIARKWWIGRSALEHVNRCAGQVSVEALVGFLEPNRNPFPLPQMRTHPSLVPADRAALVMFLNGHALDLTLNWLCNTANMTGRQRTVPKKNPHQGVHSNLVLVTLDADVHRRLASLWPTIRRLNLDVPCLEEQFRHGEGSYQLFFVLRANFAAAMARLGKPFWMIQQDTFWRANLLELHLEEGHRDAEVLFDRADQSPEGNLIAGGYFFVRPTTRSAAFFGRLGTDLLRLYSPDNVLMTRMCSWPSPPANCSFIPFQTVANWMWALGGAAPVRGVPALVQFDGDTRLGGKLARMRALGFYFLHSDGRTCAQENVETAKEAVGLIGRQRTAASKWLWQRSYSQWQFALYQTILAGLQENGATKWILHNVVYPNAHFFMLTI